jgi:hypothetical protein
MRPVTVDEEREAVVVEDKREGVVGHIVGARHMFNTEIDAVFGAADTLTACFTELRSLGFNSSERIPCIMAVLRFWMSGDRKNEDKYRHGFLGVIL